MNMRKYGFLLFGGILLCTTALVLLFPFKSGAFADQDAAKARPSNQDSKKQGPENYDAFALAAPRSRTKSAAEHAPSVGEAMNQYESRLDVPTFFWLNERETAKSAAPQNKSFAAQDLAKSARAIVGEYAAQYRLTKKDLLNAEVAAVHDTGKGAIIVKFKQNIDGVEVFRDELKVVMNRNLEPIALSGYLTGTGADEDSAAVRTFSLAPEDAIVKAVEDLTGSGFNSAFLQANAENKAAAARPQDKYTTYQADSNGLTGFSFAADSPLRVKKVYFHLADGFVPAYYVEANVIGDEKGEKGDAENLYYSYVISAADGAVLFRNNLTAHAEFSYRVWADSTNKRPFDGPQGNEAAPYPTSAPSGFRPPYAAQNLVTLQSYPFSRNDAWLPDGATVTTGNNADAYVDAVAPDGFNAGDFRAAVTAPGVFDYSFNSTLPRTEPGQRNMAVAQLFYNVNFLHDWFYDSGFNEAAGNAQADNYGRGGAGGDRMRAEAQDYSGRNNANMSTPSDGASPRMQMYLFNGVAESSLTVNSPAGIAGKKDVGVSTSFGPQTFDITGDVVLANDGAATTTDACQALTNGAAAVGKIVLADRGTCDFVTKVMNAQNAGAIGVIIADNVAGAVAGMGGTSATVTIPTLRVTLDDGNSFKNALSNGALNVRMLRGANPGDLDGTIDNQIVAHEWGHYISNRLIGNSNGLVNQQGTGMGEGWGDFTSMLLTVREEDITAPGNANWRGIYGMAGYATGNGENQSYYYGIRRTPYSTDMTKNALTFKHISDGVALPTTAPIRSGGANSEVHNTGEIWTTMLWECYASLLNAHPFVEAQDRMKYYLVAAYKATPNSPTFVEARNAMLAAAFASDPADGIRFGSAFAKRGIGVGAVAPDRASTNNVGAIESSNEGGDLTFVRAALVTDTGDKDLYLDNGETATLNFTVKNTGFVSLNNSLAIVSSDNPHVSFPSGATVNLGNSNPFGAAVGGSLKVAANGMTNIETVKFTITLSDSAITYGSPAPGTLAVRLNASDNGGTSATDTVETESTAWTVGGNPALTSNDGEWRRVRPGGGFTNQLWFGADVGFASDQYLVSPNLIIGDSGTFTMEFDHSFGFETDASGDYDGGVVEMSVDGGAWTDINPSVYNGTLITYAENANPLAGRKAFVKASAGTIHTVITPPANLAALPPGTTIKVRFRLGTDNAVGAAGWQVDNISFTGITNRPFGTLGPQLAPTAANVFISGRVLTAKNTGVARATVQLTDGDGNTRIARTNAFGFYRFDNLEIGKSYTASVTAKQITFAPQLISPMENLSEVNFVAQP